MKPSRSDDLREHTDAVARNPREAALRPRLCALLSRRHDWRPPAFHSPRMHPTNAGIYRARHPQIASPPRRRARPLTKPANATEHDTARRATRTLNAQRATPDAQRATRNAQRARSTRNAQRKRRQLSIRRQLSMRSADDIKINQPPRLTCPLFGSQLEFRRALKLAAHAQHRLPLTRRSHRAPRRDEILAGSRHPGCESSPLPCRAHLTCTLPRFADRGRFA